MKGKSPDPSQLNLLPQRLEDRVNPRHPLYRLLKRIPWDDLEKHFSDLYHHSGRPAKPIRLMVSLLILKQLYNLSDEWIVERWVENPYYQFFSGERVFQWEFPCHPTDLVYFRKRIGDKGVEKIFKVSVELHGQKAKEKAKNRFRKRAGIEPIIGHLKSDFRLLRNYLKGSLGDAINLMLAAAAYNLRKLMRELLAYFFLRFEAIISMMGTTNHAAIAV